MGFGFSGADGTYTTNGLPAGDYIVLTIDDEGLGFATEYYLNAVDSGSATAVTVVVGVDTPNIDFTLDPA